MNIVFALCVRNLRLFFRDRLNVFFSLLGAIILFLLYVLFLGNLQTVGLAEALPSATDQQIHTFVDTWMFAGIVSITSVTTGLGALSAIVDDGQSGRFRDFLVAPIRRQHLVLGYLLAAVIVSLVLTLFVFIVSVLYLGLLRDTWMDVQTVLRSLGIIALSCTAFTALSALIVSFVRTSGAYSGLATIVGTVLGFIAAAYIPIGVLPDAAASVIAALPFAQAGMLLRREFSDPALLAMTAELPQSADSFRVMYGLDLTVGEWAVPAWFAIVALLAIFVLCTTLAGARIRRRIR